MNGVFLGGAKPLLGGLGALALSAKKAARPLPRPIPQGSAEGVWGLQATTFLRGVVPHPYLAPNQICTKYKQTKLTITKGKI